MDGAGTPVCGNGGSASEIDPYMLPDFDDFDSYTDFCTGPLVADSIPSAFSFSSAQHFQQISSSLCESADSGGQSDALLKNGCDSSTSFTSDELMDLNPATVPRQMHRSTLQERMLRALALLKGASGDEPILAQVWMPVRNGDHQVLTTADQPFLLDERLTGYREISRQFTFAATQGSGLFLGLPGRVFLSGMLEWTSNVMYYNSSEYLRVDHAMRHEVRGSLALPVFDKSSISCCSVLELAMTKEKDNFCSEIDAICNALQMKDICAKIDSAFDVLGRKILDMQQIRAGGMRDLADKMEDIAGVLSAGTLTVEVKRSLPPLPPTTQLALQSVVPVETPAPQPQTEIAVAEVSPLQPSYVAAQLLVQSPGAMAVPAPAPEPVGTADFVAVKCGGGNLSMDPISPLKPQTNQTSNTLELPPYFLLSAKQPSPPSAPLLIDNIGTLQSVDLSTVKAQTSPQRLTRNKDSAFMEILDVLRAACHAHMLPVALAWVPACSSSNANASIKYGHQARNSASRKKYFLCIQESACFVNDIRMHDFVRACSEHPLEQGQGIAGNAILSNNPSFSSDVREYDMGDYPLAHHARKFGLHAAVAIRLRSTLTGNDDYVLEFFLPLLCNGGEEQQLLLDSISVTMQRACRSLRTVSDAELMEDAPEMATDDKGSEIKCASSDISVSTGVKYNSPSDIRTSTRPVNHFGSTTEQPRDKRHANKLKPSKASCGEKRRVSSEKNVSLSVLQKYFAGSLKDAAKSIGVCPTTLKRICRQQGIMRWPSRKIKKVNRSLRKIQNVISSMEGVSRELKYDPATGFLISSASPSRKPWQMSAELDNTDSLLTEPELYELKVEPDCDAYPFCLNDGLCRKSDTVHRDNVSYLTKEPTSSLEHVWIAGVHQKDASRDPLSMPQQCNTDNKNIEQSLPSSSSMTSSSGDSGSSHGTFKVCVKPRKDNKSNVAIIVKAFYKDDTLRFRLLPTMKYQQLLLEVAKRLKLSVGTFQLNYKDDEDEWVILASDADLQECRDMIDTTRLHILKVQVRDVPYVAGISSGSTSISGM
ncbi:hypothetical protein EJB05_37019 [Eragrostis curvula]|uniref:PB1 domain-containing protein n=1 Tax=Eragrostis curvula TaxID=38414 RepID=A0A5J9TZM1_9POAL|nr:hypothetical protein EJB05_37019 [Eragrostis curvula]